MIKAFQHKAALNVPSQGTGKALLGRKLQSREKTLKNSFPGHTAMRRDIWDKLPGRREVNLVQTWIKWNLRYIEIVPRSHFVSFIPVYLDWSNTPPECPSLRFRGISRTTILLKAGNIICEPGARGSADPWQCP